MRILKRIKVKPFQLLILSLILAVGTACKKSQNFDNPYSGGKSPLGAQLSLIVAPSPALGAPGTSVTFAGTGLVQYKDKLVFMFNGVPGQVTSVTSSGITVTVPADASSGIVTLSIDNQVFFGPRFKVQGKISIDPAFTVLNGADNAVNNALQLNDGRFILVGAFTNYDTKGIITPIRRIVETFKDGPADLSFQSGGTDGPINSIVASQTNYFVGGSFGGYFFNNGKSTLTNMSNIARLNANFTVDSMLVPIYNTAVTGKKKAVPSFNGGTSGTISKLFNSQGKVIAIGNFRYYATRRYDLLTNPITVDTIQAPSILRFNTDGSLDKTYRFDAILNRGLPAGNGSVNDGYYQTDNKLVAVGNFTKFDSIPAGHIVRLKADGTVDATFNAGSGTDKPISSITYNATTDRYMITGDFTTYNGVAALGLAMLKSDGSLDNTFQSKGFTAQGLPSFAKQLSNGLILVSGGFINYSGIRRAGFMVLTPTGTLAAGYNNMGDFTGTIRDVFESVNSSGKTTAMLMGSFSQLDGLPALNITRVVLEP